MKRFTVVAVVVALLGIGLVLKRTAVSQEGPQALGDDLKQLKIGDVIESVYDLDTFRKMHHDGGPNFSWFECNGTDISGTPLGAAMAKTPDFSGRYPRGFSSAPPPDLNPGESGAAGTTLTQEILAHTHDFTQSTEHFDHGDSETGPVVNDRPTNKTWRTASSGGSENRPNSVIVHFYIRAR